MLVTAHRRESQGEPLANICAAVAELVRRHEDLSVVFPVHPNPRVRGVVEPALGGLERVHLVEPLGYAEFVALMKRSYLILTDSGGVQEEAPALGKPVLVLRDETERPEAVAAGTVELVGTRTRAIAGAVEALLASPERYRRFSTVVEPLRRRLGRRADRPGRAPPPRARRRADAGRGRRVVEPRTAHRSRTGGQRRPIMAGSPQRSDPQAARPRCTRSSSSNTRPRPPTAWFCVVHGDDVYLRRESIAALVRGLLGERAR